MMTSLPRNPVSRSAAGEDLLETALVAERFLGVAHLRNGQPGGAGRGDRGPRDELQRQARAERPDRREGGESANRGAAMPGGHGGDVNRCRGDCADEQDDTEPERGERDVRARGADRVAYHANSRADVGPAEHRVERPPDLRVEHYVEDLDE